MVSCDGFDWLPANVNTSIVVFYGQATSYLGQDYLKIDLNHSSCQKAKLNLE